MPIGVPANPTPQDNRRLVDLLEPIRQKYQLPALGGAILDDDGIKAIGVVGVRARAEAIGATTEDAWHLGSDAKAMTATMIAALVEEKTMSWDTSISDLFPELSLSGGSGKITLLQLLSHRSGLPANADWKSISKPASPLGDQRRAAVAGVASIALLSSPGSTFSYSNWGYVIAGAMAERASGKSYESLMEAIVFRPLQMGSAGFGPAGTPGKFDEPWGHTAEGYPTRKDNPLVMTPAGCIHCSLGDWGKFIADQLRGFQGKPSLLKPESYARLQSAPFGGSYALGWGVIKSPEGELFTHTGSNTFNVAVVWMAPSRNFAALVVCNQGGSEKACNEATAALISLHKSMVTTQ